VYCSIIDLVLEQVYDFLRRWWSMRSRVKRLRGLFIKVLIREENHCIVRDLRASKCLLQAYVFKNVCSPLTYPYFLLSLTCSPFMFYLHRWIFIQWIWCWMLLCLLHANMVAHMQDPYFGIHSHMVQTCRLFLSLPIVAPLGFIITIIELRKI